MRQFHLASDILSLFSSIVIVILLSLIAVSDYLMQNVVGQQNQVFGQLPEEGAYSKLEDLSLTQNGISLTMMHSSDWKAATNIGTGGPQVKLQHESTGSYFSILFGRPQK